MSEHDAIESLERLGLSSYEAKVFVALQKLGVGTAREVAETTDVPRSQVYSTAESLGERGLIDVQQSSPIRYRPLSIEEARAQLRNRFERESDRAFEYIEEVRSDAATSEESEGVWTITGRETIDTRVVTQLRDARREIVLGIKREEMLTEATAAALRDAADAGVSATVISQDPAVRGRFDEIENVRAEAPAIEESPDGRSGRILVVDGRTILLSVLADPDADGTAEETAIWSTDTNFARVLVQLVEGYLEPR